MTYFILGLCFMAAVVASWQLSAAPFFPAKTPRAEGMTALSVSAQAIIEAERAAPEDGLPAPAIPAPGAAGAENRI